MSDAKDSKPPKGRPPRPTPSIPDTFENIIKALVKPIKKPCPKP